MKKYLSILTIIFICSVCFAQNRSNLPSVTLRSLDGKSVNSSHIGNRNLPVVLIFWATWCKPCIKELSALAELYEEWQDETGVVIVAIAEDDSRTQFNIRPMIKSREWPFEFYIDTNGDFKRSMGVVDLPHLFILNKQGEIIYQRTSYIEGNEQELFNNIPKE